MPSAINLELDSEEAVGRSEDPVTLAHLRTAACSCSPAATSWVEFEHGRIAGQTGADPERVEQALARLELIHCEMAAGDALFFHANTLHCSAANLSDLSRNLLI